MKELFAIPISMLKKREIYYHLRDAGRASTVDIPQ